MGVKDFFARAWNWIYALWEKYDDEVQKLGEALLPMVIETALRTDLSGSEKKKVITSAVLAAAEQTGRDISSSMLNEAIEIAANKYNIQIGKTTKEQIDNTIDAVLGAARKHANGTLELPVKETEDVSVVLSNQDL